MWCIKLKNQDRKNESSKLKLVRECTQHLCPPKDDRGLSDFYHNWTNSILQQLKKKCWNIYFTTVEKKMLEHCWNIADTFTVPNVIND